MAKFVALKETLDGGKIIPAGAVVEGKDLDKLNPKLFRKANAQESLTATENKTVVTDKQIAKVLEQVKAAALAELEDKITENVMGRVEKMLEEKIQNDKLPENEA